MFKNQNSFWQTAALVTLSMQCTKPCDLLRGISGEQN